MNCHPLVFLFVLIPALALADDAGKPNTPLRYRRVYTPADRPEEWPGGKERYVPIDTAEFERLLQLSRAAAPGGQPPAAAAIVQARYEARLGGDQLTAGRAALDVARPGGSPGLLPLEPCGLAISHAAWADAKKDDKAILGTGPDGAPAVMVERSGTLQLDWSLAGRRDTADVLHFALELPASPSSRLTLDLPPQLTPTVDHGLVGGPAVTASKLRRWSIDLGGHHRVALRLAPAGNGQPHPPLTLMRETSVYDCSLRGLELSTELKLEVHHEPLRQITLLLDPSLQLVTARYGDAAAAWSVTSAAGSSQTRVVVTLPEPVEGVGGVLRLGAIAPLETGRSWRLPRVRAEQIFWQEGTATLLVPTPLVLGQVVLSGCRQSATSPLAAPRSGESAQFQYFDPDAAIEVVLSHDRPSVQLTAGTAVELGGDAVTARVVAKFRLADGSRFNLSAELLRGWRIDAIDAEPAGAVEDWTLTKSDAGPQKLAIRLAKALSPARPISLTITAGRLYGSSGRRLAVGELIPVQFRGPTETTHLVSLGASGPFQLKFDGIEQLRRVDPRSLTAEQRRLFAGGQPGPLVFANAPPAAAVQVALENRRPNYAGTIEVEAAVGNGSLEETYRLRCVPATTRVDRVLVHLAPRRDGPVRWTIDGLSGQQFTARRWTAEEQRSAGWPPQRETWELALRRPQTAPLEIRGVRQTPLGRRQPISVASLPEAAEQRATLIIRTFGPKAVRIAATRLKPLSVEPVPLDRYPTAQAAYRYDPLREIAAAEPAVTLAPADDTLAPPAWVWNCELHSQYEANGSGCHLASYQLQSGTAGRMQLTLPAGVGLSDVRGLWVDDKPAVWQTSPPLAPGEGRGEGVAPRVLTIDLPPGEKFPTVALHFVTPDVRLGVLGSIAPPLPQVDLPILDASWTVWLPPGYDVLNCPATSAGWRGRLFGDLARPATQSPFNPLAADDWLSLVGLASRQEAVAPPVDAAEASKQEPTPAQVLWRRIAPGGHEASAIPGWTVCRHDDGDPTLGRVEFVHRDTMRLLGTVVFFVTIALVWWRAAQRPVALVWLLGIACLAALLVEPPYVTLTAGVVLGILFCLAARLIYGPRTPAEPPVGPVGNGMHTTVSMAVQIGVGLVAAAIVLLGASTFARGEAPHAKTPPAPGSAARPTPADPPVYRVIVPVDERQQPAGGKYYLPEAFYKQLHARAAATPEKPHGWLITTATYRATLASETGVERLAVERLVGEFDLQVFEAGRVRLPLRRSEVNLLPDGALLDGRVVQPEWEPDGNALLVEIAEPGPYRLELNLRPLVRPGTAAGGFNLAVPRLATSRLELTVPATARNIEIPAAAGPLHWEENPSRVTADLGPSDRLAVHWQESGGAAGAAVDVEEFLWLKVQPGSVVLDAKFKLKVVEGQVRTLQLVADPRLRLLPLSGSDLPAVQIHATAGQAQTIHLQWPRPVAEGAIVSGTFLLTETSGVGKLRLPQLDVADARITRRWMAVSVDPALEHEVVGGRPENLAASEFVAAWGTAAIPPSFACRLPSGEPAWSMSIHPRKPQTTVQQTLALSYERSGIDVWFDADLTTTDGYYFRHRLSAPPGLEIESISLMEEDAERTARWSHEKSGEITIFLTGAVAGLQKLSLRGRIPISGDKEMRLPLVAVEEARVESSTLELFRRSPILVKLAKTKGMTRIDEPEVDAAKSDLGRLIDAYRLDPAQPPKATLRVLPNRPQIRAEQVTRLASDGHAASATLDCRVSVSGGLLDEIQIEAPDRWNGPYETDPAADVDVIDLPGENRQLILRPETPVAAEYRFRITSPLASTNGDLPALPRIRLQQTGDLRRFVTLPSHLPERPGTWETRGLKPSRLPPGVGSPETGAAVYEVSDDSYQAILKPTDRSRPTARVRLADVHVAWEEDGSCRGAAVFDLEPGELTECPLWLPSCYRLVHVAVSGVPASPTPAGANIWQVPLGPQDLPQRIEVVFQGNLPGGAAVARRRFDPPRLGDLPVQQTLWTIAGPPRFSEGKPEEVESASPWQQELTRLKNVAGLLETAAASADDPEETLRWYPLWARWVVAARAALERQLTLRCPAKEARAIRAEVRTIDQKQSEIAARLGTRKLLAEYYAEPSVADDPTELWTWSLDRPQAITCCATADAWQSVTLAYQLEGRPPEHDRLTVIVVVALLIPLAVVGVRRGSFARWTARWPAVCGVLFGLAWWLWLWPSVLGLVFVFLSIFAALRRRRAQPVPPPSSSSLSSVGAFPSLPQ